MIKYNKKYNMQLLQLCIQFGTQHIYSRLKPTKRRISKYNYLYEYVLQCTALYLDETYPFNMKLYWVLQEFQDFPKCELCGKPIYCKNHKFFRLTIDKNTNKINNCWPKHCSNKCAQNNFKTRDKFKKTSLIKYGTEFPWQNKEIINKIENTMEIKYGKRHAKQVKQFKEKARNTNLHKYGVIHPMKLKSFQQQVQQNYFNKTGYYHPTQNPNIQIKLNKKYFYDNNKFDSSIELAFYIWLKDNKIKFIYQPIDKAIRYIDDLNKEHIYYPDFFIISLNQIIELKGDNHFDKYSGKMIDISDPLKNYIAEAKHQCMLKNNVKIIKYSELKNILDYCANKFNSNSWYKQFKI